MLPCSLFISSVLFAQNDDAQEDEPVFDLSPFLVDGTDDVGYRASSTLAGTRVNTPLRDIGASISIVNEAFLEDTDSQDLEDVLVLTGNTEVGGLGGNFSGSQGFGAGTVIPELQRDTNSGGITRVRGLAEADLTRDYFITNIPFDTYNTNRITVQRGANAALFGLGSPGGVVNNNLIKADFNGTRGQVKFKVDQYGTFRGSLRSYNEIIDDKLSILIAGLSDDRQFEQEEAWQEDERLYVSTLWQPAENLNVRFSYEKGHIDGAKPRFNPPVDMITPWFDIGKPTFSTPTEAGAFRLGSGDIVDGVDNNKFVIPMSVARRGPMTVYDDYSRAEPRELGVQAFMDRNRNVPGEVEMSMLSMRSIDNTARVSGFYPDGTPVDEGTGSYHASGLTDRQITDRSIFDYRKHLLDGGTSTQFADFSDMKLSVEKTWFDGSMGLEFAASREIWEEGQLNQLRGGTFGKGLLVDFNEFMGVGSQNGEFGGPIVPNENFGGVAIVSLAENALLDVDRETFRMTGYGEVDSRDFFESEFWTGVLGRLNVTGLVQKREAETKTLYSRDAADVRDMKDILGDGTAGSLPPGMDRAFQYHALELKGLPEGQTLLDISSKEELSGINIQPIPFGGQRTRIPRKGTFRLWDQFDQDFKDVSVRQYTIMDNDGEPATFSGSKGKTEVNSVVLIGQHYMFWDKLVLQGSWREDTQDTFSISEDDRYSSAKGLPDFPGRDNLHDPKWGVADQPTDTKKGQITTWSIVAHSPDFINKRLPYGTEFSLHKTKSENFEPGGGRVDVLNRGIDPVTGATEEYGFTISTLNDKLVAKVNWYETGILKDSLQAGGIAAPEGILKNMADQLDNPANQDQGFTRADVEAHLPSQNVIELHGVDFNFDSGDDATSNPNPARVGTQDFVSEGVELEISYFPTPNWNNMISISQQETVTTNSYPVLSKWLEDFVQPQWIDSDFAKNYFIDDDASETLADRATDSIQTPVLSAKSRDGSPSIEQREWRFAATTSYKFTETSEFAPEWAYGLTVGGTLRWEDEVGIGFEIKEDQFGDFVPDLDNVFYGGSQTFLDLFARYEFDFMYNTSMMLQLNIKDVTDHDDLVPVYANPDGSKIYRIMEGRLISLSATLKW